MKKQSFITLFVLFFTPFTTFATLKKKTLPGYKRLEESTKNPQMREIPIDNYLGFITDIIGLHGLNGDTPKNMKPDVFDFKNIMTRLFSNHATYYGIRINKSRFAFCPGLGYESACYVLTGKKEGDDKTKYKYHTFLKTSKNTTELKEAEALLDKIQAVDEVTRSTLTTNYVNLLLELRFNTDLEVPKDGFFVAAGLRGGLLTDAFTTLYYKTYDESEKILTKSHLTLNKWMYGMQIRMGYNRFGICYKHTLSPLFSASKGPNGTTTKPWSVSFAIDLV